MHVMCWHFSETVSVCDAGDTQSRRDVADGAAAESVHSRCDLRDVSNVLNEGRSNIQCIQLQGPTIEQQQQML